MKKGFIGSISYQKAAWLSVVLMLAGMLFSRALLSIGMVALFATAVLNPNVVQHLRIYIRNPALWGLSLGFLIYFISGLYSNNLDFWWERVNSKFPFILLPFGFIVLKNQPKNSLYWLLYLFFWLAVGSSTYVLINYLRNFNEINLQYSSGHVMHTPYSHIRFSLIVCFAIFIGGYLFKNNFQPLFRGEKYLILALSLYLVFFIHVLAVRSGLVAFYLCVLFLLARYVFINRKWLIAMPAMLLIVSIPPLAYWLLPSFQQKFNYARYDLQNYIQYQNTTGLSDAMRIMSVENGMKIGEKNFWLGIGAGDIQDEADKYYTQYPDIAEEKRMPHNQFVWIFASTGIIGLLIFCWGIFLPLFQHKNFKSPLFTCLYIIVVSSFLTEAPMEEQIGSCFYLVFMLLLYNWLSQNHD